jgi:hypothetical protein
MPLEVFFTLSLVSTLFVFSISAFWRCVRQNFFVLVFLSFYYVLFLGGLLAYVEVNSSGLEIGNWLAAQTIGTLGLFIGVLTPLGAQRRKILLTTHLYNDFTSYKKFNGSVGLFLSGLFCLMLVSITGNIGLQGIFNPESNISELRKAFTAGTEGYFAPGYAKQFRDIIFPFLCSLYFFGVKGGGVSNFLSRWALILLAIIVMLSSGQRGPVFSYIAYLMGAWVLINRRKIINWRIIGVSIGLVIVMSSLSDALGRESIGALTALLERIFMRIHIENLASMNYWISYNPAYGSIQIEELSRLLPGTQTGLSNYLHEYLGRSFEGNSPLQLFVALWRDMGYLGLFIVAVMYGAIVSGINCKSRNEQLLSKTLIYLYSVILLVGVQSLQGFLLSGIPTLLIVGYLLRLKIYSNLRVLLHH